MFPATEVDFADFLIGLDLIELSFAKNRSLMQHGDLALARDLFHEGHVMFDHDEAVPSGE